MPYHGRWATASGRRGLSRDDWCLKVNLAVEGLNTDEDLLSLLIERINLLRLAAVLLGIITSHSVLVHGRRYGCQGFRSFLFHLGWEHMTFCRLTAVLLGIITSHSVLVHGRRYGCQGFRSFLLHLGREHMTFWWNLARQAHRHLSWASALNKLRPCANGCCTNGCRWSPIERFGWLHVRPTCHSFEDMSVCPHWTLCRLRIYTFVLAYWIVLWLRQCDSRRLLSHSLHIFVQIWSDSQETLLEVLQLNLLDFDTGAGFVNSDAEVAGTDRASQRVHWRVYSYWPTNLGANLLSLIQLQPIHVLISRAIYFESILRPWSKFLVTCEYNRFRNLWIKKLAISLQHESFRAVLTLFAAILDFK